MLWAAKQHAVCRRPQSCECLSRDSTISSTVSGLANLICGRVIPVCSSACSSFGSHPKLRWHFRSSSSQITRVSPLSLKWAARKEELGQGRRIYYMNHDKFRCRWPEDFFSCKLPLSTYSIHPCLSHSFESQTTLHSFTPLQFSISPFPFQPIPSR